MTAIYTIFAGRARLQKIFWRTSLALIVAASASFAASPADAQTIGIVTMQAGTLAYTVGSAIAKVLKENAGMNALVQPTAGESVAIAIVGRGEAQLGLANAPQVANAVAGGGQSKLRLIGALHPLRVAMFVRKDSSMKTVSDLKGKRVTVGYSAMRALDQVAHAILATAGLTDTDIKPVLVPNVIRSAEDFVASAADMFQGAFGQPKVREVDAIVGGIRALEIPNDPGIAAAQKIVPYGYLTEVKPGPFFTGISHPMKVYSFDHMLYTHADVPDDVVYKIMETLVTNKSSLVAVAPALREFNASAAYKIYGVPYHPGALRYFKQHNIEAILVR